MTPEHDAKHPATAYAGECPTEADVAVIGGGLGGTIAAVRLGQMGYRVTLFDLHETPRPEFRAEQLVGRQIGRLAEMGLLGPMTADSRLSTEAINGRCGKLLDRTPVQQYGVPYQAMVAGARRELPRTVRLRSVRVTAVETGLHRQRVVLADGSSLTARLVVLATGLSSVLPKRLGIDFQTVRAGHSLALGFDIAVAGATSGAALPTIYYGERAEDCIDYLALFPMHGVTRANLFCYRDQNSEWTRAFCRDPSAELFKVMPGLKKVIGEYAIMSAVQVRSNDLRVAADPALDGVVLIGDAFQTPCPAAGTGIDRLLSDVDTLCDRHVRAWFASPGMAKSKIAAFYADPDKRAVDAECLRIADYRRAVSTTDSLWWTVHRKQVFLRRRLKALMAKYAGRRSAGGGQTMAPSH